MKYFFYISNFLFFAANVSCFYFTGTMEIEQTNLWCEVGSWNIVIGTFPIGAEEDVSGSGISVEPGFVLMFWESIIVQI
jgi:hypothetical protein